MRKLFKIEYDLQEAYEIEWISDKKQFSDYKISTDYLHFYDDNDLLPTKKDIHFDIQYMGNNIYEIYISGTIELDIPTDDFLDTLKRYDYRTAYMLSFIDDEGKDAEEQVEFNNVGIFDLVLTPIEE